MVESERAGALTIATAGDSTSRPLTAGLSEVAIERGWGLVQAGQDGCSALAVPFVLDEDDASAVAKARSCARDVPRMLQDVEEQVDPDLWIVSDRWPLTTALLPDRGAAIPGDPRRNRLVVSELTATLDRLTARGGKVAVLEMLPFGPPIECADEPISDCEYPRVKKRTRELNRLIREATAAAGPNAVSISIADIACPDGDCPVAVDGVLVRYDGIHFTAGFSRIIGPELVRRAQQAGLALPTSGR